MKIICERSGSLHEAMYFQAVTEFYEPGDPIGYGEMEDDAIASLKRKLRVIENEALADDRHDEIRDEA
jgi:hypothetical protein